MLLKKLKFIAKKIKVFVMFLYKAGENLVNHDGVEHSGYMAFITLLSFFPFLVFLMSFTSFIGKSEHGREIISLMINNMPKDLILSLKPRINEITNGQPNNLLTISIIGIIWTSSSSVEGLRTILNRIFEIHTPPVYILRRLLSIFHFFVISAIMILSMFMLWVVPTIYSKLSHIEYIKSFINIHEHIDIGFFAPLWENVHEMALNVIIFISILLLYYSIPNKKLKIKTLIPGSVIAAFLLKVTGRLLSEYVSDFAQVSVVYGGLAGVVVSLLFFYIINIIFIYGAEINKLIINKV